MPAAQRAAVRSSVLVLILFCYVPCVAPISQNARGVSIAKFSEKITIQKMAAPLCAKPIGRWVHSRKEYYRCKWAQALIELFCGYKVVVAAASVYHAGSSHDSGEFGF